MRFGIRLLCIILFVRGYYGRIMYVIIEIKKIERRGEQKSRPGYLQYFLREDHLLGFTTVNILSFNDFGKHCN